MNDRDVILLVDDEPDLLESCVRILEGEGCACVTTTDGSEVVELIRDHNPSMVITDYIMPGRNGMDILREVHADHPEIPVVMISAYATIDGVVEAVKLGAFDYLTKPFSSDQLLITVRRVREHLRLRGENSALKKKLQEDFFNHYFVGKHPVFLKTVEMIRKVAESDSNVLIRGETGTGKELAARAIHLHSRRANGPFVAVDCTAVTREMVEAGRPKAVQAGDEPRKTVFEAADGGTLYLERVEDLDSTLQARLIRIVQDRRVPLGGGLEWVPVDVRIIASTTADLSAAVARKEFRENLYYFINVVSLDVPPLRERREDVGILCDHFFRRIAEKNGTIPPSLHPDALMKLMEYDWPGNVSQFKNVIERVVSMSDGDTITVNDLTDEIRRAAGGVETSFKEARKKWMQRFERQYLENLLLANRGNILRASEMAGIARMSLYRMLKRTGLDDLASHERSAEKNRPDGDGRDEERRG